MKISINHKKVTGKPVQWSDQDRKTPVCYIVTCPWCKEKQWASIKCFYVGVDGSRNNYQCKYCKAGVEPRGGWEIKKLSPEDVFKPKFPGWRSL